MLDDEAVVEIMHHVEAIEDELVHLTEHLREVKQLVEMQRSPPRTTWPPRHFAEETPHFGNII